MRQRTLKRLLLTVALVQAVCTAVGAAAGERDDIIFRAMQDEMQRSLSDLVMEGLERPYFLAYTIDDFQTLEIRGTLGTLVRSNLDRLRYLQVELRVGDRSLDNTNFESGFQSDRSGIARISIEDDYDAIRNKIYLTTDRKYKESIKYLSKKRAYLQGRVIKNRPDDFMEQPANEFIDQAEPFDLDKGYFEGLVRTGSAVFQEYPMIDFSQLKLYAVVDNQYFFSSVGSKSLRGSHLLVLKLTMTGKGSDGGDVTNTDHIIAEDLSELPDEEGLVRWARSNADKMKSLIDAGELEEYAGPVIFAGDAAGEFFRQLLAKNISDLPVPINDNERMAQMVPQPEFGNKVKRRVLPASFDVYDDPTLDQMGDMKLFGGYEVDDAGNAPQRVRLVEKGKLVDLLIGVAPTKKIREPNGHARGSTDMGLSGRPSNLILESSDEVPSEQLKQSMLELCQDFDLEYGLIIRRLGDPSAPERVMSFFFGMGGATPPALTEPLEAYKVFADGREIPVRNLEFSNVTARILRDILQTSEEQYVYSYLIGNDPELPVSIVCPAILIEEMELKKSEEKVRKPPVLASPLKEQ